MNDKVSGTVISYYENGNIKEMYSIENGKRTGVTSYYDSTGESRDIVFEDGVRKGQDFLLIGEYREEDYQKLLAEWKERQLKKNNRNDELSIPPVEDENKIMDDDPVYYISAEVMPEPIGGMNTIYKKLVYPEEAKKKKIEGTVKVLAFIEKDGEISSAKVVEGIGFGCDENARLSVYYTRFKPGLIKGKRVKVQMIIPIEFKLDQNSK
jgi:protein TonB